MYRDGRRNRAWHVGRRAWRRPADGIYSDAAKHGWLLCTPVARVVKKSECAIRKGREIGRIEDGWPSQRLLAELLKIAGMPS